MFLNIPVVSNRGIKIQSEKSSNKNQRNNKNTDRKLNNNLLRLCKFYARPNIESQNRMLNFKSHIICITEKQEGVAQKHENNNLAGPAYGYHRSARLCEAAKGSN